MSRPEKPTEPVTGRILVVEDEETIAAGIRDTLLLDGYAAEVVVDGARALERILAEDWDLVLLDVMLPGMDGFTVCERVRAAGDQVPILFLTAKDGAEDRIRGLELGGDDYLPKPFALRELLLRVAAILRRKTWYATPPEGSSPTSEVAFGGNAVDFKTYTAVAWDGTQHQLTHKEALILKCLADREGEIVSREEILEQVWGYEIFPSTRTIDNFIVRLRKRFEREPDVPRHFHTQRGVGYRLTLHPETP